MPTFNVPQTGDEWLLFMGNVAIAVMGALMFRIAVGHWWCRYGREAMVCAAAFLVTASGLRFVATNLALISLQDGAIANGFSALAYVTIMLSIVYMHRCYHWEFGAHAATGEGSL